jgi:hypothetical protein
MSYIGASPTQVAFVTDTFSGNGSTTAFTMSVAPANAASVLVAISGVLQDPTTYSVAGTALTFSAAPPAGTGNISSRYLGIPASNITTTAYRTITEFTATAAQTTFTPASYTVGFIEVYRNGVLLGSADYTASNGTTVVLAVGATAGDLVTVVGFYVSSVINAIPATTGSVNSTYIAAGAVGTTQLASAAVTPTILSQPFTAGTSQASTSGTSISFTSIPSWVKRVTVMFNGVSLNGSSAYLVQIGSGSTTTSGYVSMSGYSGGTLTSTAGFVIFDGAAANIHSGTLTICQISANNYVSSHGFGVGTAFVVGGGNAPTLSGALDRIVITTVNGTDTFDAGAINILYE